MKKVISLFVICIPFLALAGTGVVFDLSKDILKTDIIVIAEVESVKEIPQLLPQFGDDEWVAKLRVISVLKGSLKGKGLDAHFRTYHYKQGHPNRWKINAEEKWMFILRKASDGKYYIPLGGGAKFDRNFTHSGTDTKQQPEATADRSEN